MKDNAMIDSIVGASVNVAIVAGLAALVVIGAVLLVRRHTALPATMSATQAPTEVFYYEPPVQGGRKPRA